MPATKAIGMIEVILAACLCGKQTMPSISTKSFASRLSNVTCLMIIFPLIKCI